MSFLKEQRNLYALIYTNTAEVAYESGIIAVVRICFGSDDNSISVPYVRLSEERKGYQMPAAVVVCGAASVKLPLISGPLWMDLVELSDLAMKRVKDYCKVVPMGRLYKVHRDRENQVRVEEIAA